MYTYLVGFVLLYLFIYLYIGCETILTDIMAYTQHITGPILTNDVVHSCISDFHNGHNTHLPVTVE